MPADEPRTESWAPERALETTARLLVLVRDGDSTAREQLMARYLPILQRWARGRLPSGARAAADTDDLVQITLIRALNRLEEFEPRREGAFLAYLRTILANAIREEVRRTSRRPRGRSLDETGAAEPQVRPADMDTQIAYDSALASLPATQQEAVILRLEFGFSYLEIAAAIEGPSADAARMLVKRAMLRVADTLGEKV